MIKGPAFVDHPPFNQISAKPMSLNYYVYLFFGWILFCCSFH
uniref:Uncharacterized protein n=1 Tax=Rhizophora mucronata TaxID=61149 RepID=A0A2P2IJZ5_RHIMU